MSDTSTLLQHNSGARLQNIDSPPFPLDIGNVKKKGATDGLGATLGFNNEAQLFNGEATASRKTGFDANDENRSVVTAGKLAEDVPLQFLQAHAGNPDFVIKNFQAKNRTELEQNISERVQQEGGNPLIWTAQLEDMQCNDMTLRSICPRGHSTLQDIVDHQAKWNPGSLDQFNGSIVFIDPASGISKKETFFGAHTHVTSKNFQDASDPENHSQMGHVLDLEGIAASEIRVTSYDPKNFLVTDVMDGKPIVRQAFTTEEYERYEAAIAAGRKDEFLRSLDGVRDFTALEI